MAEKRRLDNAMVELGLCESREKAKSLIMAGIVYVNNQKADKAGTFIADSSKIEMRGNTLKYVSRGGLKLEKAVESFKLKIAGLVCMDVGASTGGFTDCMLQNGAKKVYSVDVGYGQLAWKLRTDERVINMERTNFRYVTQKDINDKIAFASVDVSFISLSKILPVLKTLLTEQGEAVCLIKPQFEAGREKVGKKGVVRDISVHKEVIRTVCEFAKDTGFKIGGLDFSPVKGPEGNIEYLMYLKNYGDQNELYDIDTVVDLSHKTLNM